MFHPVGDGLENIRRRWASRGPAVLRTGGEEQPGERVRVRRAEGALDALVVVDRSLREDELVSEPVPDNDLPAAMLEGRVARRTIASVPSVTLWVPRW